MRRLPLLLATLLALAVLVVPAAHAQETTSGVASRVLEGDTVEVTLPDGTRPTVRLLGIDAPDAGECGADEAAEALRAFVEGRTVQLTTDPSQDTQDVAERPLRYVDADAVDAGREMVRLGWADVQVRDGRPFARQPLYEQARAEAREAGRGVGAACDGEFHLLEQEEAGPSRREAAERFVRSYYHRISTRRYARAWAMLSPSLRKRFGPYSRWRAGYRRSLGTRVNRARGSWNGSRAGVSVAIRSRDRDACSGRVVKQYFRGRWTLTPRGGGWRATAISLRKVGGGPVRTSRSECPKPKPKPRSGGGGGGGGGGCHPSYTPCIPNDRDYDCGELDGPYTVSGPDEYRLDGDGDGVGCE